MTKRPAINRFFAVALVLGTLLPLLGCRGGARIRDGWSPEHVEPGVLDEARDGEPRLQVFVCYDQIRSTHTALRVTGPRYPPVLWDPGGDYGKWDADYGRVRDVVLLKAPDLGEWWRYRREDIDEPFVLVFEWDLPREEARSLQARLINSAYRGGEGPWVDTSIVPGLCSIAISRFLHAYTPWLDLGPAKLMPDGLAGTLWEADPDRVLRYDPRQGLVIWSPPQATPPEVTPLEAIPPHHAPPQRALAHETSPGATNPDQTPKADAVYVVERNADASDTTP